MASQRSLKHDQKTKLQFLAEVFTDDLLFVDGYAPRGVELGQSGDVLALQHPGVGRPAQVVVASQEWV